jgi:hypothetical protein
MPTKGSLFKENDETKAASLETDREQCESVYARLEIEAVSSETDYNILGIGTNDLETRGICLKTLNRRLETYSISLETEAVSPNKKAGNSCRFGCRIGADGSHLISNSYGSSVIASPRCMWSRSEA